MRHRFFLLGLCAAALLACDSANPVAPSGTVLSITANPSQIGLTGQSTITVTGFKPDANRLNPGTQIILSTSRGDLFHPTTGQQLSIVEIDGTGTAAAILRGNGRAGEATVTATLATAGGGGGGGDDGGGGGSTTGASASTTVQIGVAEGDTDQVSITASPSIVNLNETATITATARNSDGTLFGAGGSIQIRTDLGTLSSSGSCGGSANSVTITTNANSEAVTTLCAGDQPGTATLTATFGSSMEAMTTVTIENQVPSLIINANPDNISTSETSTITVIARDENNVPLGSGFRVQLLASFGTLDPSNPVTNSEGIATSTFDPAGDFGTAEIQAFLGSSDAATVSITVRGDVARVQFTTIQASIQRADQEVELVARVFNSRNEGVASVVAQFEVLGVNGRFELPGTETSSDGSIVTNTNGDAAIDLDLTVGDLDGVSQFDVKVSVATESGTLVEDQRTILVQ